MVLDILYMSCIVYTIITSRIYLDPGRLPKSNAKLSKNKLSGIRPDSRKYPVGYRIARFFADNPAGYYQVHHNKEKFKRTLN